MAIVASPSLVSSAFTKRTSNSALWMTSFESPMKARKSSTMLAKTGLSLRTAAAMPVDAHCVLRDVALRIDERVKDLARQALVHDLDRANLQHPMPVRGIETRRFRIEHDFTHGEFGLPPSPRLSA